MCVVCLPLVESVKVSRFQTVLGIAGSQDLKQLPWDSWVAQSVKQLTWAQVMISWFVSSSPVSGPGLTAWSLFQALSLSLCASSALSLSLKNT